MLYFMKKVSMPLIFNSLINTILFLAVVHLSILIIYALIQWSINPLNIFKIIDIRLLFPMLGQRIYNDIFSSVLYVVIFLIFLLHQFKKAKLHSGEPKIDKKGAIPYDNDRDKV